MIKRFFSILIALFVSVILIAILVQRAKTGSSEISQKISQAADQAMQAAQSAAGKMASSVNSNTSSENTEQGGSPAIPVTPKITQAPNTKQPSSKVSAPVANSDLESVWGDTGTKGLTVYEYGKTLLSKSEKRVYINIANAVRKVEPSTTFSSTLSPKRVEKVYEYYLYDHAEIFYMEGVGFSYTQIGDNYTYTITFKYKYSGNKSRILSMRSKMGQKALALISLAKNKSTDYGKEKVLHDNLIKLCSYDINAAEKPDAYPDSYSAYGALVNKKSVCQGYAQAMKLLLSSAGVKSLYISGEAKGGSHAWNMVDIGGHWRYLDATFDDPVFTNSSGEYVSYNTISYTYFNYISNPDHVAGKFNISNPFSGTSENYATMPKVS